jgi:hypothetical protein
LVDDEDKVIEEAAQNLGGDSGRRGSKKDMKKQISRRRLMVDDEKTASEEATNKLGSACGGERRGGNKEMKKQISRRRLLVDDEDKVIEEAAQNLGGGSGRRGSKKDMKKQISRRRLMVDDEETASEEAANKLGGERRGGNKEMKKLISRRRLVVDDEEPTSEETAQKFGGGCGRRGSSKEMKKQISRSPLVVADDEPTSEEAAQKLGGCGRRGSKKELMKPSSRRRLLFDDEDATSDEASQKFDGGGRRGSNKEITKQISPLRLLVDDEDRVIEGDNEKSDVPINRRNSSALTRRQSIRRSSSMDSEGCLDSSSHHKSKEFGRKSLGGLESDESLEEQRVNRADSDGSLEIKRGDRRRTVDLPQTEAPDAKEPRPPQRRKSGSWIIEQPSRQNLVALRQITKCVRFQEDSDAKNGAATAYIESEGILSPEEKVNGWYNSRNYKLFKSVLHNEAIEARESMENEEYRQHFEKVYKACESDSIDFEWQVIMNAEHKKGAPNSAVVLAKARFRGFERDIFPETLLRKRTKAIKAVIAAYEETMLSMTMSPCDQAEAVRTASQKLSQPFRRFARVMAEGEALLIKAWDRVIASKKKSKDSQLSDDDESYMGGSSRNLLGSCAGSRRDLKSSRNIMAGMNSSSRKLISGDMHASCRHLMANMTASSRNLVAGKPNGGRSLSRRDLMSNNSQMNNLGSFLADNADDSNPDDGDCGGITEMYDMSSGPSCSGMSTGRRSRASRRNSLTSQGSSRRMGLQQRRRSSIGTPSSYTF